jgi:hypothetical protein
MAGARAGARTLKFLDAAGACVGFLFHATAFEVGDSVVERGSSIVCVVVGVQRAKVEWGGPMMTLRWFFEGWTSEFTIEPLLTMALLATRWRSWFWGSFGYTEEECWLKDHYKGVEEPGDRGNDEVILP